MLNRTPAPHGRAAQSRPKRRNKEQSHRALLRAAFELLAEGQTLTTVAVTRRAGLSQSSFYVHFTDVDDCTLQAVREVVRIVYEHASERQGYARFSPVDRAALEAHLARVMADEAMGDIHRVFNRFLYEPGPVGEAVRQYFAGLRAGLIEDLWKLAMIAGVSSQYYGQFALQAELVLAAVRAARAALREGRCRSIEEATTVLSRNFFADFDRALRECGGEPERIRKAFPGTSRPPRPRRAKR